MQAESPTILVPAETKCLERIRTFCRMAIEGHTRDRRLRSRLVLAIDEAAANVIEHAYADGKGKAKTIQVSMDLLPDRIVVRIQDRGEPFDPTRAEERAGAADFPLSGDDLFPGRPRSNSHFPRHGFGLQLIRDIMDEIDYRRTSEGENLLILTKKLGSRAPGRFLRKGGMR